MAVLLGGDSAPTSAKNEPQRRTSVDAGLHSSAAVDLLIGVSAHWYGEVAALLFVFPLPVRAGPYANTSTRLLNACAFRR